MPLDKDLAKVVEALKKKLDGADVFVSDLAATATVTVRVPAHDEASAEATM